MFRAGTAIRERRLERGLSVSDTARRAGITRAYLHRIEGNAADVNPSAAVLERLAMVLGFDDGDELGAQHQGEHEQKLPPGLRAFIASRPLGTRERAALKALIPYATDGAGLLDWAIVHRILSDTILPKRERTAA